MEKLKLYLKSVRPAKVVEPVPAVKLIEINEFIKKLSKLQNNDFKI